MVEFKGTAQLQGQEAYIPASDMTNAHVSAQQNSTPLSPGPCQFYHMTQSPKIQSAGWSYWIKHKTAVCACINTKHYTTATGIFQLFRQKD